MDAEARHAELQREEFVMDEIKIGLNAAIKDSHGAAVAAGWWNDLATGECIKAKRNRAEMLCLIHSEISEAMEGERKKLMDDKLPHRPMPEVELADVLIRVFDYCGAFGYDLAGAYAEKRAYNDKRADHKPENRVKENGKKF